jgi:hypothetical protein
MAAGIFMKMQFGPTRPHHCHRRGRLILALMFSVTIALLTSGCTSLLPTSHSTSKSPWKSFQEAQAAFDQITLSKTRTGDLKALGFDPSSPNVKVLTYLDVIQRFMPTPAITKEDLEKNVRECLEAKDGCHALELEVDEVKGHRTGNVFLDVLGFRRTTHQTGWRFKALFLLREEVVVYKLSSGEPVVDRLDKSIKPLGPLQELDGVLAKSIPSVR